MRQKATALVALALSLGSLAACGSGPDYALSSADVERAVETEVRVGAVEAALPAGAATGGTLAVQEGPAPENVPEGVLPLGSSALVSLFEGSLDGVIEVSFDPPAELAGEQVPVVMAKDAHGEWQWLPTSWDGGQSPVTAELEEPGQVFLARFDRTPWLDRVGADFTAKATSTSRADAPTCGDEDELVQDGLQVSSEPGEVLLWCAGVDTVGDTSAGTPSDLDYSTDGVQARVLRLRNNSRMFHEVGYPADWPAELPATGGAGSASLAGQSLRGRLGLAGATREGLATRVLAPGDTLTLVLPEDPEGTVTADLSAAAWTLSAIDFATNTYTRLVSGVDQELGHGVRTARERLLDGLLAVDDPEAAGEDTVEPVTAPVSDCLAPVADVVLMSREAAQRLLEQVTRCAPIFLRPALPAEHDGGAAVMADGVASSVLAGLPTTLGAEPEPWAGISDALTDASAGFQVWVGEPPAREYDYTDAPHVFRPGEDVDVEEWSTEFTAYVEERLDDLLATNDLGDGAACPDGTFTVTRYRTDGFALAGQVSCGGDPWTLVLGRSETGWQEIDEIQQDPYFGCSVMGTYEVPASIAGGTCLDGEQTQEYTG